MTPLKSQCGEDGDDGDPGRQREKSFTYLAIKHLFVTLLHAFLFLVEENLFVFFSLAFFFSIFVFHVSTIETRSASYTLVTS